MCGDDTGGEGGSFFICFRSADKSGTFRERLIRVARQVPWKPIAILTSISTVLLSLLLLPACCCVKGPLAPIAGPPKIETPLIGTQQIPTPSEAASKAPTQALM